MRVAVYFTPAADAQLTRLAARWLGRHAFSGESTRPPDARLDPLVAKPARYGFHATMKAPFRLSEKTDLAVLEERLARFCATQKTIFIPELRLQALGDFLALVPETTTPELHALEAAVVRRFDDLRAPLLPQEIEARQPDRLDERQRRYLREWGYPFVLEEFRFHMTLTGPLPAGLTGGLLQKLQEIFTPVLSGPLPVDGLALFIEPAPDKPFQVHSHHAFGAA